MQKKAGRSLIALLSIALLCVMFAPASHAQTYPKGPVQIIIPFAPGGVTDIFWRGLSDFIARNAGAAVSLVTKTGGGGIVGTSYVVNSKPDGYTLVAANSDPLNIAPLLMPDAPYIADKDLTYICKLAGVPVTIAVRADSPFKTLEDLVAFAKANPGRLKGGVAGVGTVPHISMELFNRAANIQIAAVPFGGAGEVVPNLLGGHVDLTVMSIPPLKSHVVSGKVRILASFSPKRPADFPQIPTVAEKGYKSANISMSMGLAGPKGLPPAVVKLWEQAGEKAMKDPKVVALVDKLEGLFIDFRTGEEYKKEILTDLEAFRPIVAALKDKK